MKKPQPVYTLGEEILSAITHGVGAVLAAGALVVLVFWALLYGDAFSLAGALVYGISLIILYIMSTLYHSFPAGSRVKRVFRVFDHGAIFLLIAGTYTPYTLITLRGAGGWVLFAFIWSVAILGIVLNAVDMNKFKTFSGICYLVMGWAIIVTSRTLSRELQKTGFWLLIAGGIVYTLGFIFYKIKNLKYMHSVWHFFVLSGSILHFFSILLYVLPCRAV